MIHITKEVDYAIQLLVTLNEKDNPAPKSLRLIAIKRNISFLFLQKIARKLKQSNLIDSIKGANGGYILKKNLKDITLKDVTFAMDNNFGIVSCMKENDFCEKESNCVIKPAVKKIHEDMNSYMEKTKLADIVTYATK